MPTCSRLEQYWLCPDRHAMHSPQRIDRNEDDAAPGTLSTCYAAGRLMTENRSRSPAPIVPHKRVESDPQIPAASICSRLSPGSASGSLRLPRTTLPGRSRIKGFHGFGPLPPGTIANDSCTWNLARLFSNSHRSMNSGYRMDQKWTCGI